MKSLVRDTRGANKAEYLILVGLVAILALGAYRVFGGRIQSKTDEEADRVAKLEGWGPGKASSGPLKWKGKLGAKGADEQDDGETNAVLPQGSEETNAGPKGEDEPKKTAPDAFCSGGQCLSGVKTADPNAKKLEGEIQKLGEQAKQGNRDAKWALREILLDGIGGRYRVLDAVPAGGRRDLKLQAAKALAAADAAPDYMTAIGAAYALGEAAATNDPDLAQAVQKVLDLARERDREVVQMALEAATEHPEFPGKPALLAQLAKAGGRRTRDPAPPPPRAQRSVQEAAPAGAAASAAAAPPQMTMEKALAAVGRLGYFKVLDRDKNHRHWDWYNRGDLVRLASGDTLNEIPPEVREAARFLAQPENFKKLDTAHEDHFGVPYRELVRQGRGGTYVTKIKKGGTPDDKVTQIDLVAAMDREMSAARKLAVVYAAFDKLDVAAFGGDADGLIARIDLEKAWQNPHLPLEARAAAKSVLDNLRKYDTAADDLAGVTHQAWQSAGRGGRMVTVKGGKPDGLIGKRDIKALLPEMLAPELNVPAALEILRRPAAWGKVASGGKVTQAGLQKAAKTEGLPLDVRIAARFLSDPKNWNGVANASGTGAAGVLTRVDLQALRPAMLALKLRLSDVPAVDPTPEAKAEYDGRLADVRARVDAHADAALQKIQALERQMAKKLEDAWTADPDGLPDNLTAKLREEYRTALGEILAKANGDKKLAEDFRKVLEDGVSVYGSDAFGRKDLVVSLARMLDVDEAKADFIGLGAAIASKSEVRVERDAALHRHKAAVREELVLSHGELGDAFRAVYQRLNDSTSGIFSAIGAGLADIKRNIFGETTYMDLVREYYANTGVGSPLDALFKLALDLYGTGSPSQTGFAYDRFWAQHRVVVEQLEHFDTETAGFCASVARWRDGYTSVLAALPALTGVGVVWSIALGATIKGSTSVVDDATGGRTVDWSKAGYNVVIGGLENASMGAGQFLGKAAGGFAGQTLGKSLGPLAGRLAETGVTITVRGGTAGGMIGGGRAVVDGQPLDRVVEHTWQGAAWGVLFDATLSAAGAGIKRVMGPAPKTLGGVPETVPQGGVSSGDTLVIEAKAGLLGRGQAVAVRRSSGAIEKDWEVFGIENGEVIAVKSVGGKPLVKRLTAAEVFELNPKLLEGQKVRVLRSDKSVDEGWVVGEQQPGGRFRLSKEGVGYKDLSAGEILGKNPELAGKVAAPPAQAAAAPREPPKVQGEARAQSEAFRAGHRVEAGTKVADGYVDGGRGGRIAQDGSVTSGREVIVVDRARDAALRRHLDYARSLKGMFEVEKAEALAKYVDDLMTPAAGRHTAEGAVNSWLEQGYAGKEVLLGDIPALGGGVCRHRALLYKVLADEAGLDVALVRGNLKVTGPNGAELGGHAWNELKYQSGETAIVDVMNPTIRGGKYVFPKASSTGGAYYDMGRKPLYGPAPKTTSGGKPDAGQTQVLEVDPIRQRQLGNAALAADAKQLAADMKKAGVSAERLQSMKSGERPLQFESNQQYQEFAADVQKALEESGLDGQVRIKGTGTTFYSENPNKPLGHHYDKNPAEPADLDLGIESKALTQQMKEQGIAPYSEVPTIYRKRHVHGTYPKLDEVAQKWSARLGRDVSFVGLVDPAAPPVSASDYVIRLPGSK